MKIGTMIKYALNGQAFLMWRLAKMYREFFRMVFLTAGFSDGIFEFIKDGPATVEKLLERMGVENGRDGLESWLNLGVCLGELRKSPQGYRLSGGLSRALMRPVNDAYQALIHEIGTLHYDYITQTLPHIRRNRKIPFSESYGELIARSSRSIEALLFEAVDRIVPRSGKFRLLEVGCGSGIYIRRACERNRELSAVGLEMQPDVARAAETNLKNWKMDARVRIHAADVRKFRDDKGFDLVTLYNNIYYFPMDERVALLRTLKGFVRPGGRLVLATGCQGGGILMEGLNLWASMTEGAGPLPIPEQLCRQMSEAGFVDVSSKQLVPFESFTLFMAKHPRR